LTEERPERLAALLKVVRVEEVVGAKLERLYAAKGVVAEVTGGGEGGEGELEVVGGVGVGSRRGARIHEGAETEDDEDACELCALTVAR